MMMMMKNIELATHSVIFSTCNEQVLKVSSSQVNFFFHFQYKFIEHTHVQLTFTKDNLQQNETTT